MSFIWAWSLHIFVVCVHSIFMQWQGNIMFVCVCVCVSTEKVNILITVHGVML